MTTSLSRDTKVVRDDPERDCRRILDMPLQEWFLRQLVRKDETDNRYYYEPMCRQVMYVRDEIAALVGLQKLNGPRVISEHRSKSVHLPVYQLSRPDLGLRLTMRNNFYNWMLSVESEKPITTDFSWIFHTTPPVAPDYTGDPLASCYFEGFPRDFIFGYMSANPQEFSAEIGNNQLFFTTILLLMKEMGTRKPLVWHTRESHRLELAALSAAWKAEQEEEKRKEASAQQEARTA